MTTKTNKQIRCHIIITHFLQHQQTREANHLLHQSSSANPIHKNNQVHNFSANFEPEMKDNNNHYYICPQRHQIPSILRFLQIGRIDEIEISYTSLRRMDSGKGPVASSGLAEKLWLSSFLLFFFFAAATNGRGLDPLRPRLGLRQTRDGLMNESRPSILGLRDTRDEDACRSDSIGESTSEVKEEEGKGFSWRAKSFWVLDKKTFIKISLLTPIVLYNFLNRPVHFHFIKEALLFCIHRIGFILDMIIGIEYDDKKD